MAAAFAQLFTIPVSVIATRQQLADKSISFLATLKSILADDGITGLWRGLKPSLVLTVNPAITYGMFERLKTAVLKDGEKMTPGKAFVLGALSKTMATVVSRPFHALSARPELTNALSQVTYPYIMAKTRLQAKYTDDTPAAIDAAGNAVAASKKERYSGAIDVLTQTYREKGFAGWYQVCYSPRSPARTLADFVHECRACRRRSPRRCSRRLSSSESRTPWRPTSFSPLFTTARSAGPLSESRRFEGRPRRIYTLEGEWNRTIDHCCSLDVAYSRVHCCSYLLLSQLYPLAFHSCAQPKISFCSPNDGTDSPSNPPLPPPHSPPLRPSFESSWQGAVDDD